MSRYGTPCDGEIRRYGKTHLCGKPATWHIQVSGRSLEATACGSHIRQILNDFREPFGDVEFVVRRLTGTAGGVS